MREPVRACYTSTLFCWLSVCISLLTAGQCNAAFEGTTIDSRAAAMGDCWSVSRSGLLSLAPLPPPETSFGFSFSYSSPYGLSELEQKNISCIIPIRRSLSAIGILEKGGSLYKERILTGSVTRDPLPSTRISVSLSLFLISINGLPESRFTGLSVGVRSAPLRSVTACVGLGNVISSENRGILPKTFLLGIISHPAEAVTVAGEVRKIPGSDACLHLGVELEPERGIKLRFGLQSLPVELSMGFGIDLGHFSIETGSFFHTVLGRSDVLTLSWGGK